MRYPRVAGICIVLFSGLLAVAASAETQGSGSGTPPRPQGLEGVNVNGLSLEGFLTYNYQYNGNSGTLRMTAERVRNSRMGGISGTLQLQLWATTTSPIFG